MWLATSIAHGADLRAADRPWPRLRFLRQIVDPHPCANGRGFRCRPVRPICARIRFRSLSAPFLMWPLIAYMRAAAETPSGPMPVESRPAGRLNARASTARSQRARDAGRPWCTEAPRPGVPRRPIRDRPSTREPHHLGRRDRAGGSRCRCATGSVMAEASSGFEPSAPAAPPALPPPPRPAPPPLWRREPRFLDLPGALDLRRRDPPRRCSVLRRRPPRSTPGTDGQLVGLGAATSAADRQPAANRASASAGGDPPARRRLRPDLRSPPATAARAPPSRGPWTRSGCRCASR